MYVLRPTPGKEANIPALWYAESPEWSPFPSGCQVGGLKCQSLFATPCACHGPVGPIRKKERYIIKAQTGSLVLKSLPQEYIWPLQFYEPISSFIPKMTSIFVYDVQLCAYLL